MGNSQMNRQEIPTSLFLTPQEHLFIGGTPAGPNPYKPIGLGQYELSEIIRGRENLGTLRSGLIGLALGFKKPVVISLSGLDSEGVTLSDPKILGVWDSEKEELITYPERDLTKELIEGSRSHGLEIPMRDQIPPGDISKK